MHESLKNKCKIYENVIFSALAFTALKEPLSSSPNIENYFAARKIKML